MAKPAYAPKLDTLNDIRRAVEDIWAEVMDAKNAMHYLQVEMEEDWSKSVKAKDEPHVSERLGARTWLSSTTSSAVDSAAAHLSHLINNIPDKVEPSNV